METNKKYIYPNSEYTLKGRRLTCDHLRVLKFLIENHNFGIKNYFGGDLIINVFGYESIYNASSETPVTDLINFGIIKRRIHNHCMKTYLDTRVFSLNRLYDLKRYFNRE